MKVSFQNVSKQYKGKYALKNFTTELSEGVYGLLGANGANQNNPEIPPHTSQNG